LLGYDFFFEGLVIEGNKMGRTLGFPTANLGIEDPEKLLPGNGVYAVKASLFDGSYTGLEMVLPGAGSGSSLSGMMNIGYRPTVGGGSRTIEVNIFDFDQDIYGQRLAVFVRRYLRGEQKFSGLDALKEQLKKDKLAASDREG
jgi:riboflavin kinase/FMN adenylyltransferase